MKPLPVTLYNRILSGLALCLCLLGTTACPEVDEPVEPITSQYEAVVMTRAQLESSIKAVAPRPIQNPSKIYTFGSRIYMIDLHKGVHIIDNTDPASPQNKGFVVIPGVNDVVAKDDVLLADNGTDMVGINVQDPSAPQVLWRRKGAFRQILAPDGGTPPSDIPSGYIIVDWTPKN